ncbi:MAG: NnrS family protein [Polyangiaceae bacterium]
MSRTSLPMHDAPPLSVAGGPAVLAKGFRPFFLAAALYVGLALPLWSLVLAGRVVAPFYVDPVTWHAHEMVFGFGVAVVAGFLLTAVGNWTQSETATGAPLAGLLVLWLAGRLAMLFSDRLPRPLVASVDVLFVPALALVLARPIVRAKNRRNYAVVVALVALTGANVMVHLDALGLLPAMRRRALLVSVDVIVFFLVLVTGRVVAMFTKNATRDAGCKSHPRVELLAVVATATLVVGDAAGGAPSAVRAATFAVAAGVVAARAVHWGALSSFRDPMLWVLHVGHAFLPLGLALRAIAEVVPAVPSSLGVHAITAGAIGALCIGMMARVSLGHTGRAIAAPRGMALAFGLVVVSALVRMGAAVAPVGVALPLLVSGSLGLSFAFVAYAVVFARILTTPRADGKAG